MENLRNRGHFWRINVKFLLLNIKKIIKTSFNPNNSWRFEGWQHHHRSPWKNPNYWFWIEFSWKIKAQITNFALCCLRIFEQIFNWLKSWYLEFWNFYKSISRGSTPYFGFLPLLIALLGLISNFQTTSHPLQSPIKMSLEKTTRR